MSLRTIDITSGDGVQAPFITADIILSTVTTNLIVLGSVAAVGGVQVPLNNGTAGNYTVTGPTDPGASNSVYFALSANPTTGAVTMSPGTIALTAAALPSTAIAAIPSGNVLFYVGLYTHGVTLYADTYAQVQVTW